MTRVGRIILIFALVCDVISGFQVLPSLWSIFWFGLALVMFLFLLGGKKAEGVTWKEFLKMRVRDEKLERKEFLGFVQFTLRSMAVVMPLAGIWITIEMARHGNRDWPVGIPMTLIFGFMGFIMWMQANEFRARADELKPKYEKPAK